MIGGAMLGHLSAFSSDYEKAKIAAARLFKIFDRKSAIDSSSEDGLTPVRMFTICVILPWSEVAKTLLLLSMSTPVAYVAGLGVI